MKEKEEIRFYPPYPLKSRRDPCKVPTMVISNTEGQKSIFRLKNTNIIENFTRSHRYGLILLKFMPLLWISVLHSTENTFIWKIWDRKL